MSRDDGNYDGVYMENHANYKISSMENMIEHYTDNDYCSCTDILDM
jgi:hypothetical protein